MIGMDIMELVSIVLINYKDCKDTIDCLASLENSTYKNFEVIIIDNESSEKTYYELSKFTEDSNLNVKIIPFDTNLGFAAANNRALEYIDNRSRYLFILNNDTIVKEDCIEKLVGYYENVDQTLYAITGKAYYYFNKTTLWWAGEHPNGFTKVDCNKDDTNKYIENRSDIEFITGAFMFLETDKFRANHYDEDFFFGYEDYELGNRIRRQKLHMDYVSDAIIWHKVGQTRSYSPWHIFNYYACQILLIKKQNLSFVKCRILIKEASILSTLYIRYKRKKGINMSFSKYLKLTLYTFKVMKTHNSITEQMLNDAKSVV